MSDVDADVDMDDASPLTYEELRRVLCNPEQFALKEAVWYLLRAQAGASQREG